jgi:hypothetical protein
MRSVEDLDSSRSPMFSLLRCTKAKDQQSAKLSTLRPPDQFSYISMTRLDGKVQCGSPDLGDYRRVSPCFEKHLHSVDKTHLCCHHQGCFASCISIINFGSR